MTPIRRRVVIGLAVALIAGAIVATIAAPRLLTDRAIQALRGAGFAEAQVERAWIDLGGLHFAGIALDSHDAVTASSATIPLSAGLLRGRVGHLALVGARIRALPRMSTQTGAAAGGMPDLSFDLKDIDIAFPVTGGVVAVTLDARTISGETGQATRIAVTGTARHDADRPMILPLKFSATLTPDGDTLTGALTGHDESDRVALTLDGTYRFSTNAGTATIAVKPISFSPQQTVAALSPALASILGASVREVTGTIEPGAKLVWDGKVLQSGGRLVLTRLAFDHDSGRVSGLSGALEFASLAPPRLANRQRLHIDRIDLPSPVTAVDIELSQTAAGVLRLARVTGAALGGTFALGPLDLSGARQRLVTTLTAVDVAGILAMTGPQGLSGTGELSGTIEVEIEGASATLQQGQLAAKGGGRLSYAPTNAPNLGAEGAMLIGALSDFRYDTLTLSFARPAGGATGTMHITGHNPDFQEGRPVNLNINLTGDLEEAFRGMIGIISLPEDIRRQIAP